MLIIGCDFHSRFQQIAMLDPQTGEVIERRLEHETEISFSWIHALIFMSSTAARSCVSWSGTSSTPITTPL